MNNSKALVKKAEQQYQKAAVELGAAIRKAYPVGSLVTVTIGRSTFEAEITGHNECWWSHPEEMYGRNTSTGKLRTFSPCSIQE